MSLPSNNNAVGSLFGQVSNIVSKSRKNAATAFNRRQDFKNAALLEGHKSNLRKDEHTHSANEASRIAKEHNQAIAGFQSAGGRANFFNAESYINKNTNNTNPTPYYASKNDDIEDANVISVTPARTTSNVSNPAISYSSPKAIGSGSSFISSSNGETTSPY